MMSKYKFIGTEQDLTEWWFILGIFSPIWHNPFRYQQYGHIIQFNPKNKLIRVLNEKGILLDDQKKWLQYLIDKGLVEVVDKITHEEAFKIVEKFYCNLNNSEKYGKDFLDFKDYISQQEELEKQSLDQYQKLNNRFQKSLRENVDNINNAIYKDKLLKLYKRYYNLKELKFDDTLDVQSWHKEIGCIRDEIKKAENE